MTSRAKGKRLYLRVTSLDEHTGRRNPYLKVGVSYEEAQTRVRSPA